MIVAACPGYDFLFADLAIHYAHDAALPSLTADGLQRSLDVISETNLNAYLITNTAKAEVLCTSPSFLISGKQLKYSENLAYFGSNLTFSGDLTNEI